MKENKPIKNLTIGEVSRLLNVKEHTIRFWEKEFPVLNPKKNDKGRRVYDLEDMKLLQKIKKLLYQDNYTIKGALKELEKESYPVEVKTSHEELPPVQREEKAQILREQNLDSLASKKQPASEEFYRKINKEILLRFYQEVEDLIRLWEDFPHENP